jgi:hypothetical protein
MFGVCGRKAITNHLFTHHPIPEPPLHPWQTKETKSDLFLDLCVKGFVCILIILVDYIAFGTKAEKRP